MTDIFTIGNTNFGIESGSVRLEASHAEGGELSLWIEVRGNEALFDIIAGDDEHRFSWASYPPKFYLRGIPIAANALDGYEIPQTDIDEFDAALYMMEHNLVSDLTIFLDTTALKVTGTVDLMGTEESFCIQLGRHNAA